MQGLKPWAGNAMAGHLEFLTGQDSLSGHACLCSLTPVIPLVAAPGRTLAIQGSSRHGREASSPDSFGESAEWFDEVSSKEMGSQGRSAPARRSAYPSTSLNQRPKRATIARPSWVSLYPARLPAFFSISVTHNTSSVFLIFPQAAR